MVDAMKMIYFEASYTFYRCWLSLYWQMKFIYDYWENLWYSIGLLIGF